MALQDGLNQGPAHRLLAYVGQKRSILIMCHNNPDPDTIAAAFALKSIFLQAGKRKVTIGYGGIIGRAENRQFVRRLKIDLTHVREIDFRVYSVICLVDTQPHTGNNALPQNILPHIVIDHHPLRRESTKCPFFDVRPKYGSSSTILTEYLRELNFTVGRRLATALFYGLKTDTNELLRSTVKADLDAFTFLFPKTAPRTLAAIENPSIPKSYFLKFADAIDNSIQYQDAIVSQMGKLTTPDIVGEMADFLLRMEGIRWTLCLGEYQDDLYMSVRTSRRRRMAGMTALRIVHGLGTGGGHEKAAAGKIPLKGLSPERRQEISSIAIDRFLKIVGVNRKESKPITAPPGVQRKKPEKDVTPPTNGIPPGE
ncbi:MAG: bifunctional oligoribonuclease/PAP phosphatase NrnA [Deltaproteobacteria bacterium]|nr:bifunctional oligoribonuclease/PAP phosphatase NrnA [Deltaproteobacteria bacterium]